MHVGFGGSGGGTLPFASFRHTQIPARPQSSWNCLLVWLSLGAARTARHARHCADKLPRFCFSTQASTRTLTSSTSPSRWLPSKRRWLHFPLLCCAWPFGRAGSLCGVPRALPGGREVPVASTEPPLIPAMPSSPPASTATSKMAKSWTRTSGIATRPCLVFSVYRHAG